jgi:hypothetical protein
MLLFRSYLVNARHSIAALNYAFTMNVEEAADILTHHQRAGRWDPNRAPLGREPVGLTAARIVREWIDRYGSNPAVH